MSITLGTHGTKIEEMEDWVEKNKSGIMLKDLMVLLFDFAFE